MDNAIVKQIDALFNKHLKGLAKKTDLDKFATKNDLKDFATKQDLKDVLKNYPTKQDLKDVLKNYPTKQDLNIALKDFATKKDLKYEIDEAIVDIIHAVEESKADKESLSELDNRVKTIEGELNLTAQ